MITLPDFSVAALMAIVVFVIVCGGTRALIGALSNRAILDNPNDRSSHDTPTPRGGGIAILALGGSRGDQIILTCAIPSMRHYAHLRLGPSTCGSVPGVVASPSWHMAGVVAIILY